MSLTYGFYNSLSGDRKYDAKQLSAIFDGIIEDGVFQNIGDRFAVTSLEGMDVAVGTGRAWFNHTWSFSEALIPVTLGRASAVFPRIDTVVLQIDSSVGSRENSIVVVEGVPSAEPVKPELSDEPELHQHALAHILRRKNTDSITQAEITNAVGTSETPFVTGPLTVLEADIFINQWESQWQQWLVTAEGDREQLEIDFGEWFESLQTQLEGDIATNLALQISNLQQEKADKVDLEEIEKQLKNYNSYANLKDDNGVFTAVEYKRSNGTKYMTSLLSNADAEGNYRTLVWKLYSDAGTVVNETITWAITYDADGDILSKVVN